MGPSAFPVTSHTGPSKACAASSVSRVPPSWLMQTRRWAPGGAGPASSACSASPPVWAAWYEVPQPVNTTRPSGSRRSPTRSGTPCSHSGWSWIALRVSSPGMVERDGNIPAMEGFRFVCPQEVSFRDLDVFGHVNNAVYLTYIENARIGYMRDVLGIESLDDLLVIVANVNIDFRSRASLGETLDVGARVSRIGTKSFDMEHEVRGSDGRLVAAASTTLVTFDYRGNTTMPVPDLWRERIETFEAKDFAAA